MLNFNLLSSRVRKRFVDVFSSRSDTTGSLGDASDGSKWTNISGTIEVKSGVAKSTTTPISSSASTDYPLATVTMPTENNTITIKDTNEGSSVALWVQSSSDWWMVDIDSTFNTIPGNSNYGATGSNYGIVGTNYGVVGSNYSATGSNYGAVGTNYSGVGSNYSAVGSNYSAVGSNYGAVGNNYGATGTNYGATGTNAYNKSTTYSLDVTTYKTTYNVSYSAYAPTNPLNKSYKAVYGSTQNVYRAYSSNATYGGGTTTYGATGSNYGAVGTNYGATGSNYGATGTNYGATGTNYGATGSNYGVVGTNYGATGSNYGFAGSNYGFASSNYGVTGTNPVTYAYAEYLRVRKSVSSVVSSVTSALISTTQTIKSLSVSTSGNQITAKAYSDPNLVTQIGSDLVYTPTGVTITTQFGISISPSDYNQSAIIGSEVNITRN